MNPRRSTPSMSWLLAFESTARHLSFTRAAEELALTQSVISRHVQGLENLLGVGLLRRDGSQMALTDVGVMYLREVQAGLQRIRNASLQAHAYSSGGAIHLASLPTFATKWLMPRLTTFYAEHPGVLVHVHSRIGTFDLELAGMDAAISLGNGVWPGMLAHHILDDMLVAVMSPALASRRPVLQPEDLFSHNLLQLSDRVNSWSHWFAAHGNGGKPVRLGPQFEMTPHLLHAVMAGIGVGLVPSCVIEDELRDGTLVAPFAPLATGLGFYLIEPAHRPLTPALAVLKHWLLGVAPP